MNYILHLNKTFEIFCEDERLTPFHVSLYFSLFQYWNMARFRNPISISRDEVMRSSKIGSVNTYIRCIKELDKWEYIKYVPSYNPQKGSQVYLFNFNNSNNNASDISNNKGSDKADRKTSGKAGEKQVIPSINNTNKSNKLNNKKHERSRSKNSKKSVSLRSRKTIGRRKPAKKSSAPRATVARQTRPLLKEITEYFASKRWPAIEAEKFFNYYQSNGWLVGGKTPMKNWKAASQNWILNSAKFNSGKIKPTPGKLQTSNNKNYGEPL